MAAAAVYFLMAIMIGDGQAASFMTLGEYQDAKTCQTALTTVDGALGGSPATPHLFCVSSDDVSPLARAAHPSE